MTRFRTHLLIGTALLLQACASAPVIEPGPGARYTALHQGTVFADMHAHPSRFHRANVDGIALQEISVYRNSLIDLAHSNHETMMDVIGLSRHPVIFSHGGVRRYTDHDRAVTDDEIRAISENGGLVGIWPHGRHIATLAEMVDYIEHVIDVGGIEHVGIGSDLRGISRYTVGFDDDAKFYAIAEELFRRGYSDDDVGKVMGGNFFRVWQAVTP